MGRGRTGSISDNEKGGWEAMRRRPAEGGARRT